MNFSTDFKWCPCCKAEVTYLQSTDHSYCTTCDTPVRLFEDPVEAVFQLDRDDEEVADVRRYTDAR